MTEVTGVLGLIIKGGYHLMAKFNLKTRSQKVISRLDQIIEGVGGVNSSMRFINTSGVANTSIEYDIFHSKR